VAGPWVEDAACRGVPVTTFFASTPEEEDQALAVCGRCPVAAACLRFAVHHEQWHGIWGGTTERARRPLIRAHRADHADSEVA
jgi:WhiB family redox-sensing transcriptional regulator